MRRSCGLGVAVLLLLVSCADDDPVGSQGASTVVGEQGGEGGSTTAPPARPDWRTAPLEALDLCRVLSTEAVAGLDSSLGACTPGGEWTSQVRWPGDGYSLTLFVVDAADWGGDRASQAQARISDGSAMEVSVPGAALAWFVTLDRQAVADFGDRLVVIQMDGGSIPSDPATADLGALLQAAVAAL